MTPMITVSLTDLFEKAGGRYNLAGLAQKRAAALLKGAPPLVEKKNLTPLQIALTELDEGKICLDLPAQKKDRTLA